MCLSLFPKESIILVQNILSLPSFQTKGNICMSFKWHGWVGYQKRVSSCLRASPRHCMISFFFFSYVSTHMCLMVRWGCFVGGMVALAIDGKGNVEKFGRRWVVFFLFQRENTAGKGNKKKTTTTRTVLSTVLSFAVLLLVDGQVFFLVVPQLCRIGIQWGIVVRFPQQTSQRNKDGFDRIRSTPFFFQYI